MLDWLTRTIAGYLAVLALGLIIGYASRRYRGRVKVSLATHIEQSWTDRSIHMSITNHGNDPIIVDSWTVHMPMEELLPRLAKETHNPEPPEAKRLSSIRRFTRLIGRLLRKRNRVAMANDLSRILRTGAPWRDLPPDYGDWKNTSPPLLPLAGPERLGHLRKRNRVAMANDLSRSLAFSLLNEPHLQHQLMDPGTTQRIEPRESAARIFPRTSTVPQTQPIVSDTQHLTIIPSCHVIGHRRRLWGWPSFLGGNSIPISAQLTPRASTVKFSIAEAETACNR